MDNQKRVDEIKIELSDLDNQYFILKAKNLKSHEHRLEYSKLVLKVDTLLAEYYKLHK